MIAMDSGSGTINTVQPGDQSDSQKAVKSGKGQQSGDAARISSALTGMAGGVGGASGGGSGVMVPSPSCGAVDVDSSDDNDDDDDDDQVEGDYSVYECPGLAPTGEMEVKNPLFTDSGSENKTNPDKSGRSSTGK